MHATDAYITEGERCGLRAEKTMNTKVEFQKDETNKLKQVHAAKLMAKQRRRVTFSNSFRKHGSIEKGAGPGNKCF